MKKALYKTAAQVEFAELFERLKWKKAHVAYALHIKPPAITMILNGDRSPREATLAGMRELVNNQSTARANVEKSEKEGMNRDSLIHKLDRLRECDPPGYQSAAAVINTLAENLPDEKRKPSSTKVQNLVAEIVESKAKGSK